MLIVLNAVTIYFIFISNSLTKLWFMKMITCKAIKVYTNCDKAMLQIKQTIKNMHITSTASLWVKLEKRKVNALSSFNTSWQHPDTKLQCEHPQLTALPPWL